MAPPPAALPAVMPPTTTTFYQRPLPDSCTAFSSPRGKSYFRSALQHRGLASFYALMEQHSTQTEPTYCGLSSLVICLNTLAVDPRQTWKGPWRWYSEAMLNCCVDLEYAKQTGITLAQFHCLAQCQGLVTELYRVDELDDKHNASATQSATPTGVELFRIAVRRACMEQDVEDDKDDDNSNNNKDVPLTILVACYSRRILGQTGSGHFSPIAAYDEVSDRVLILDTARFKYSTHWVPLPLLYQAMQPIDPDTGRPRGYMLLSYSAPPGSLETSSSTTGSSDGSNTFAPLQQAILLQSSPQHRKDSLRMFKEFFLSRQNDDDASQQVRQEQPYPTFLDVFLFCTRNGTDLSFVWSMTRVHLKPVGGGTRAASNNGDAVGIEALIDTMRQLLDVLLAREKITDDRVRPAIMHGFQNRHAVVSSSSSCDVSVASATATATTLATSKQLELGDDCTRHCRPNFSRTVPMTVPQVVYLFYLATLSETRRREHVYYDDDKSNETSQTIDSSSSSLLGAARQQLLVEAELLRRAIDVSDHEE
jgi:glutathione gamma-glutamylcysteinyltransferase